MSISNDDLIADIEEISEDISTEEAVEEVLDDEAVVDDVDAEDDAEDLDEAVDEETVEDEAEDTFTFKVNGDDITVSESDLIKGYSTNKASQAKFAEASKMRKDTEQIISLLRDDPISVLEQLGFDVNALSEDHISEQLRLNNMTEEQRELYDAKQKLAGFEKQKEINYKKELDNQTETARQDYITRIDSALVEAELPTNDFTTKRMAYYLKEVLTSKDDNIRALTDSDIVELVEEDYMTELRSFNPDKIEAMLGKDVANKIRKNDIAKVQSRRNKKASTKSKPAAKRQKEQLSWSDYQKYLDDIK